MKYRRLPEHSSFRCSACNCWREYSELNTPDDRPLCDRCYLADPPQQDVDGVFAEVAERYRREVA